jgi:hypothetical protein
MAPAVIDRYEKDLPGIVLDVKIYVRDRTSRRLGKDRNGQA